MLAARLRIADASKSGCTSPVAGPASVFGTQIGAHTSPRALPAFQNSLERRREGVQLLDALLVLLVVAAPAPLCRRNSYAHQKPARRPEHERPHVAAKHPSARANIPGNLVCRNELGARCAAKSVFVDIGRPLGFRAWGWGAFNVWPVHWPRPPVPHAQILFPDNAFC